jgi:hypothetical protein
LSLAGTKKEGAAIAAATTRTQSRGESGRRDATMTSARVH